MTNFSLSCQYAKDYYSSLLSKRCTQRISFALAFLFLFFISTVTNIALASPLSSPVSEQYHILTSSWQLSNSSKEDDQLTIKYNGKDYVWKVDRLLLANRLDPNAVDADAANSLAKAYLNKLAQLPPHSEIIIELVNNKKLAPLVVAGIGIYDQDQQWQHATQFGSRTLNLSAEKVKALGSAEKYHKKVLQFCDQEWTKIKARPES